MSAIDLRTAYWPTLISCSNEKERLKPQVLYLSPLLTLSPMIGMISGCNFKGHGGGGGGGGRGASIADDHFTGTFKTPEGSPSPSQAQISAAQTPSISAHTASRPRRDLYQPGREHSEKSSRLPTVFCKLWFRDGGKRCGRKPLRGGGSFLLQSIVRGPFSSRRSARRRHKYAGRNRNRGATIFFSDNNNTQHQLVFHLDGSLSAYLIQLSPDFEIGAAQLQTGVVTKSGVDITTQTVEGLYAAGSLFLPPGTLSSLIRTEVTFDNVASPPTISNPSQLLLVGPAGRGLAFLVQR